MANLPEPIGEAWMTGPDCTFANGHFAGRKLSDAWPEMSVEWTGTSIACGGNFPLLVKFIFTEEKLSVQVHPGDEYASLHESATSGRGKTEIWYACSARPGAEVMVGLKPSVTRGLFERAIADGTAEDCIEHIPIRAGEAVFVPAGTAHTIGPGLTLCEIQQQSDLTYRVYDYDRRDAQGHSRPLHIEKALAVMRFGKQIGGKIVPAPITRGSLRQTYFAACRYFVTDRWEFGECLTRSASPENFELVIFLEGRGCIRWSNERAAYAPAQVWLIPAALGSYQLEPENPTTVLHTYVPRSIEELSRKLAEEGVGEAERSRLIHV
jgi:mannose-6-phosphate isomerase